MLQLLQTAKVKIILILVIIWQFIALRNTHNLIKKFNNLNHWGNDNDVSVVVEPVKLKYILFQTSFWGDATWETRTNINDPKFFKTKRCPETNCLITSEKSFLKTIDMFDALLFHVIESKGFDLPQNRSPHQIYIAADLESPSIFHYRLEKYSNIFNWTMNYRMNSDVQWDYGIIEDIKTGQKIAPAVNPPWRNPDEEYFNESDLQLAMQKNISAAWMVSNCASKSFRNSFVASLREYIKVDIYGACTDDPALKYKCIRHGTNTENSICDDYVTEKLFKNLQIPIIPIVFGGANYSRFAPPKSYINANDFEDTQSLAKYLLYLEENPREYIKYFWWKKYYRVRVDLSIGFCEVCKKLHAMNDKTTQSISDLHKWFFNSKMCSLPKIKFPINFNDLLH